MLETSSRSRPSFLGIGAHKGGTTWLHKNLKQHPQVWLPPKKELHYFDRSEAYPSSSHLCCSRSLVRRAFGRGQPDADFRLNLLKGMYFWAREPSLADLGWYHRYFFGKHNDDWYRDLFPDDSNLMAGEITPAYSMLQDEDVERVSRFLPNAKIVFLLRNPIARTWSAIRYRQKRRREPMSALSKDKMIEIVDSPSVEMRADYEGCIRRWRKFYSEDAFFIGFYDDIKRDPKATLLDVYRFLGVDASERHIPEAVGRRVNVSPKKSIPDDLERYLAQRYLPQVKWLREEIGGAAETWLAEYEQILAGAS